MRGHRAMPMLLLALLAIATTTTPARSQTCTTSATTLAFGVYNGTSGAATDSVGTVSVQCQALVALSIPYTVGLSAGSSGTFANRRLRNGTNGLDYQIYSNVGRSQVWGDGTGGAPAVNGSILLTVGNLSLLSTLSAYGRIAGRQNVPGGVYTDTIQVILIY